MDNNKFFDQMTTYAKSRKRINNNLSLKVIEVDLSNQLDDTFFGKLDSLLNKMDGELK